MAVSSVSPQQKKETREFYRQLKENSSCICCGFKHPAVIEFHHVNPSDKKDTISNMVKNGVSIFELSLELAKCVPVCANHHRIIHYNLDRGLPLPGEQLKLFSS